MRAFPFAGCLACLALFFGCGSSDDTATNGGDAGPGADGGASDGALVGDGNTTPGSLCQGSAPAASTGAQVTFDVDLGKGPSQVTFGGSAADQPAPIAVSDYVYGINAYPEYNYLSNYPSIAWTLFRWGGDSYSTWNYTNNDSNGGNDNGFTNTNQFMPFAYGNVPSDPNYHGNAHDTNTCGAIVDGVDSVPSAQAHGAASLVTVPLQKYVAANGSDNTVTYAPSSDFVSNKSTHAAGGSDVYQDDFVSYLKSHYSGATIFYSLDNEPNYWKSTHPETFGTNDLSFDELVNRGADFATAIKGADPGAKTFGPVVAGVDGMTSLDDYGDLAATNPYKATGVDAISYYLAGMSAKSSAAGKRLLDVLDLHYYNDALGKAGTAKAAADCVQGPRDFWDPSYSTPDDAYDDYITGWKPRVVVPRMLDAIAKNYPGTLLSFSEYNDGCELAISGGVAQADILGIFGQYGVYAATAWPLQETTPGKNWLVASFAAYRGYDGNGASVGSLALNAKTTDAASTSVYAFAHPGGAGVELVLINKTNAAVTSQVRLANACPVSTAKAYQLTGDSTDMKPGASVTLANNAFTYTLPAMSVTTVELR